MSLIIGTCISLQVSNNFNLNASWETLVVWLLRGGFPILLESLLKRFLMALCWKNNKKDWKSISARYIMSNWIFFQDIFWFQEKSELLKRTSKTAEIWKECICFRNRSYTQFTMNQMPPLPNQCFCCFQGNCLSHILPPLKGNVVCLNPL